MIIRVDSITFATLSIVSITSGVRTHLRSTLVLYLRVNKSSSLQELIMYRPTFTSNSVLFLILNLNRVLSPLPPPPSFLARE